MDRRHIVVVGNGMVGQRFVDRLVAADECESFEITVVGEETRPAYDRVALSSWFAGTTESELCLVDDALLGGDRVDYRFGRTVESIDTDNRMALLDDGTSLAYDELVLATGSSPFVPPIPGHDSTTPARSCSASCASTDIAPGRTCSPTTVEDAVVRSAGRRSPRSSPRCRTATSWTATRLRCRTPTTTTSPTCSATAPTR